jgi:hypothetical protein
MQLAGYFTNVVSPKRTDPKLGAHWMCEWETQNGGQSNHRNGLNYNAPPPPQNPHSVGVMQHEMPTGQPL